MKKQVASKTNKASSKEVSVRQFAKDIGTSHTAVQKAIKEGKFTKGYSTQTGKITPLIAVTDDWVVKQSNAKPRPGISRTKALEKLSAKEGAKGSNDATGKVPSLPAKGIRDMNATELLTYIEVTDDMPMVQAMRYREIIALALDKIKLKKEEGILVEKEKVHSELFSFGSMLKKALLNIPARIIDDLLAAPTKIDAISILTTELNEVLRVFSSMADVKEQVRI